MESLDPQCTPLKHRYDSCFNLWFEGYLQPALDGRIVGDSTLDRAREAPASAQTSGPSQSQPSFSEIPGAAPDVAPTRKKVITNWSDAFRSRLQPDSRQTSAEVNADPVATYSSPIQTARVVDKRGKTRAQIKAEEYDMACGQSWRDYQGCLKNAIARNTSLSTLLDQARAEHPLASQEGLGGTAWDPDR